MPTEKEFTDRIRAVVSHADLVELIKGSQGQNDPFWGSGHAFEYAIIRGFELEDADVRYPYHLTGRPGGLDAKPGTIEQIDGAVYVDHIAALIESKDHGKPVDIEPVAKLRFRLERRPSSTIGMIFSREGITEPAAYLLRNSQPKNILLWQGREIEEAIAREYLVKGTRAKYRHMVEYGLPDYNLLEEFEK